MKIGHYVPVYRTAGGIQSYVRRISEAQCERGHEVLILERGGSSLQASEGSIMVEDDVDLLRRAALLDLDVLHFHAPVFAPDTAFDSEREPALVRTMHGHHAYCPSGSRFLARTRTPCPRRYTLTGCFWGHVVDRCGSVRPQQLLDGFRRVENEQKFLARCHTITISEFSKTQMLRSGYNPSTISVIYNPAPAARPEAAVAASNASNLPIFLFLGRMVPGKGLRWLLQAAARVRSDVRFEIIGDGPEKPSLVQLAHTLRLSDRLIWSDWLEKEDEVFARLAAARALVFPSLWQEPAGLVTSEAAAAGRAMIASRVGGIPEYAAKLEHAVLVEPGDVAGLASAIDSLASDSQHAAHLGLAGWHQVAAGTLSLETHLGQLEAIYACSIKNEPFPAVQTS